jgi:hypothetical protein
MSKRSGRAWNKQRRGKEGRIRLGSHRYRGLEHAGGPYRQRTDTEEGVG